MTRRYPGHPIVGVGAIVWKEDAVLLVRRGQEPAKGEWTLPGGVVELGETMTAALRRELREEAGIEVEILGLSAVVERIFPDPAGRIEYHYLLLDFLCLYAGGEPRPASDIDALAFVPRHHLSAYRVSPLTQRVVDRAWHQRQQGTFLPLLG